MSSALEPISRDACVWVTLVSIAHELKPVVCGEFLSCGPNRERQSVSDQQPG